MADHNVNILLKAKNAASGPIGQVERSLGRLHGAGSRAAHGLATVAKVAAGALVVGLGALGVALVAATKRAAAEEKGVARLDAALKANVKGFKGNRDEIEKVIKQREALAFTDDALRASLARLVAATGNVDKAFALQATAMDLARLKGIGLEEASVLLIRAQNGNTRALKELGIQMPKNASQVEILAAVQKKAAGQAEAYGKTTAGSFESFQIAVDDLVEDVGARFLPMAANIANFLRGKVLPAVEGVIDGIGRWVDENRPLLNQIAKFAGETLKNLVGAISAVVAWIGKFVASIANNKEVMSWLRGTVKAIADAFTAAWQATAQMVGALAKFVDTLSKNQRVIDTFRFVMSSIAFQVRATADALRDVIRLAQRAADVLSKIRLPSIDIPHFAEGGIQRAGVPSIVGEHGPELQVPLGNNLIIPNHALGAAGGGMNISLTYAPMYSTASQAEAQRFARAVMPEFIREARRQKVIA